MQAEPGRLVFIDETSVKTNMCHLRGRSLCGKRLRATAPFGKWGTQTFIGGLRCGELTAPWIIDGAMNRTAFEVYVETQLAPTLSPRNVVFLDNLSVHHSQRAERRPRQAWRVVPVPAEILARTEPGRDGLLTAEGASAFCRHTNL